eukprot:5462655-Prymnesium_polylepis.1
MHHLSDTHRHAEEHRPTVVEEVALHVKEAVDRKLLEAPSPLQPRIESLQQRVRSLPNHRHVVDNLRHVDVAPRVVRP